MFRKQSRGSAIKFDPESQLTIVVVGRRQGTDNPEVERIEAVR